MECTLFSFFTLGLLCVAFVFPISYFIVLFAIVFRFYLTHSGIPHLLSTVRKLLLSNNLDRAIKLCGDHPGSQMAAALQEYIKGMRSSSDFRPTKDRIEEVLQESISTNRVANNLTILFDVACVLSFVGFTIFSPYNEVWIAPVVLAVPYLAGILIAVLVHVSLRYIHGVLSSIPQRVEDLEKSIQFITLKDQQTKP